MEQGRLAEDIPFPTGVGMNRLPEFDTVSGSAVPHRRGDEPVLGLDTQWAEDRSPQAWG